jgi:hypothetical protein
MDQLVMYGLPIRPIFSKKLPSKSNLRKKLVSYWHLHHLQGLLG